MHTSRRHGIRAWLTLLAPLALALLLGGCTVAVRPGSSTTVYSQGNVVFWAHLNLRFDFPGVVVISRSAGPHHFDSTFRSDASLYGVYGDVDRRMRERGWHRWRYQRHADRIIVEYEREGQQAHVLIVQEGRSGRYRMTIDE